MGVTKIQDMEWRKPNWNKGGKGAPINTVACKLYNPLPTEPVLSLEELVSGLYVTCKDSCVMQYAMSTNKKAFEPDDDVNVEAEVQVRCTAAVPPPVPRMLQASATLPTFSEEQVAVLAKATSSQALNTVWKEQRLGRITASIVRSVLVRAKRLAKGETDFSDALVDTIMGRKTVPENLPAIKYGIQNEPVARESYLSYMHGLGAPFLTFLTHRPDR